MTAEQNQFKFATYYRDKLTSLDYAKNRYYSSQMGRFLSPDPNGASARLADPESWNRYTYVENDPVNFNDPSGLIPCSDTYLNGWHGSAGEIEWRPSC